MILFAGANIGDIRYQQSVDEIYNVQMMPGVLKTGILNHTTPTHRLVLHTPDAGFWADLPGK